MFLRANANTYISGELQMKGLPEIDNTTIDIANANIQTNNKELAFLYKPLASMQDPNLSALGNVQFHGNLNGTLRNFTAKKEISALISVPCLLTLLWPFQKRRACV